MKLFWKIFSAVFVSFVAVVGSVSYLVTMKQVTDAQNHLVDKYTTIGGFVSREIAHDFLESRCPFERLYNLTQRPGFLFWWVVREDGVIRHADKPALMDTVAYDYFPQMRGKADREGVTLNRPENYGIFITPLTLGRHKWSFWLGFSLTEIAASKRHIILLDLFLSLGSLLILGVILYFTIRHYTAPIQDLTRGAAILGRGDLSHRVNIRSGDELGELADAFNQMAAALQETTDYLHNILKTMLDALIVVDRDGRIITVNRAACDLLGLEKEQLLGMRAADIFAADVLPVSKLENLAKEGDLRNYETFWRTGAGQMIPVLFSSSVMQDEAGRTVSMVCTAMDITERQQAEEALRNNEQFLADIFDSIQDGLSILDPALNILRVNAAMEKFGYPQPIVGRKCYEVYHNRSAPCENCPTQQTIRTGNPSQGLLVEPLDDGSDRFMEIHAFPMHNRTSDHLQGVIEFVRDVSESKRAEEERLRFSKLESLATLAGGIAHDFNNILTAILGNIGLAMLEGKIQDEVRDRLYQAEQACLRAQSLSQQLLTFAKGGIPIKKLIAVPGLLKEAAALTLSGSKSRCQFAIPDDLWAVEADEGQISQVFSNLLINADQAMPEGGIIKIRAENWLAGDNPELFLPPGQYLKLTFADQGVGISPQYLDKIFDPYFSTKQRGSGLGLTTAYSIIQNHGGAMQVESQLGVGTTFYLYLPAIPGETLPHGQATEALSKGHGRVLVMDDEQMVREVLGRMLNHLGYEADFARDGSQAIEKFVQGKASGLPFDVVILDLTVPGGMGGKKAVQELLKIDPQVKTIVSSGYSDDAIMADFHKYGFHEVIAKPYGILELDKVLQKVMAGQAH